MRLFGLSCRPLSLCLALLLAPTTAARAVADEPIPDEIKLIISKTAQLEGKIKNLSMHVDLIRTWNDARSAIDNWPKRKMSFTETVDSNGRCREEGTGQLLIGLEGATYKLVDGTIRTAFDGASALRLREAANPKGEKRCFGAYVNKMEWAGIDPREVTTHIEGKSFSEVLSKTHIDEKTYKVVQDGVVKVLETVPVQYDGPGDNRGLRKQIVWIAPHLGHAMIYWANMVQSSPDQPWLASLSTTGGDYKEVAPGVFLPSKIYQEEYSYNDYARGTFVYRIEGEVNEWKVNQDLPAETFTLAVPEGAKVFDERKKPDGQ